MFDIKKVIKHQIVITARIRKLPVFEEISGGLLGRYSGLGCKIALTLSGFKCEKCSSEKDLTWHHLISGRNKGLMDMKKYFIQRN